MIENEMIAMFDADEFIKENYQPVEDKPGYVWLNKRNMRMISTDVLKAAINDWNKRREGGSVVVRMGKMKCETCLNSHPVLSENGYHYNCCLGEKSFIKCITGEKNQYLERPLILHKKEDQNDRLSTGSSSS